MTTDTAVLVSHEILGQQRPFNTLAFVDEPTIPMDDDVAHFLDQSLSHDKLLGLPDSTLDFKAGCVDVPLRQEAREVL